MSKLKPKWIRALQALEKGCKLQTPYGITSLQETEDEKPILCFEMRDQNNEIVYLGADISFNDLISVIEEMDEIDIPISIPRV